MAIHLKSKYAQILLRKEFARDVLSDSNVLGYKDPTNCFRIRKFRIHLSGIILYRIHVPHSVNGKTNPMSKHSGLATNPESFALV